LHGYKIRSKLSKYVAKDKKFDLNLKHIAERAKNNSVIYNSISDAYLNEDLTFDTDTVIDVNFILTIAAVALAILNTIAILIIMRKLKTIGTILLLTHKTQAAAI
jgi:hypothetical protein